MNGQADNVHWENANISGIQIQADAWHAGRCNDVVALSQDSYLVASDTGGVWYATLGAGGANLPLTDSWDNPNVTCLAEGSNHRFYAGCGRAGALFESSPGNASFWFPIEVQQDAGAINRIRVAHSLQRIVLACDNGIFWSDIPAPNAGQGYTFKPATGVPRTVFSDIALGPGDSVVAALWGSEASMRNPARSGGIIRLAWTAADLVMSTAAVLPADVRPGEMGRTSLAACQSKPGHMYAITAGARPPGDARTLVLAILRSDDGGASWRKCDVSAQGAFATGDVTQLAGKQGGRNQCIAVAPNDPEVVAFGWQAGPFLSTRGGLAFGGPAWRVVAPRGSPHLHADLQGLYFDPSTPRRVLICSDGGVVVMPDFMEDNFVTIPNRYLANLQFESNPVRGSQSGARFSALHHAGTELMAGGLQDNGNVYSRLGPQATPWRHIETGDGRLMMLFSRSSPQNVQGDIHLLYFNNGDANARIATWDPIQAAFDADGAVPVRRPGPSQARFLEAPIVGRIKRPRYRRVFRSPATMMYAVAGKGNEVYGLFGTLALPTLSPLDAGWELLGTLPLVDDEITAIDSLTGLAAFVGTRSGRIFALDAASGNPLELVVPLDGAGEVQRLLELPNGRAFATVLREEGIVRTHRVGLVLRLFGSFNWGVLRGGGLPKGDVVYSLEGALGLAMVFVATDKSVYMSRDNGDHWQQAASGLPARPLCSDLSFASDGTNHFMYLSTFGRSVWRTRLTLA